MSLSGSSGAAGMPFTTLDQHQDEDAVLQENGVELFWGRGELKNAHLFVEDSYKMSFLSLMQINFELMQAFDSLDHRVTINPSTSGDPSVVNGYRWLASGAAQGSEAS